MPLGAFAAKLGAFNMRDKKQIERLTQLQGATALLSPELYPEMVSFGDILRPATLMLINPSDIGAAFGPGVSLKRVWIKKTDDPITSGLGKKLLWLDQQKGALVEGPTTDTNGGDAIIHQITDSDLRRGMHRRMDHSALRQLPLVKQIPVHSE